MAKIAMVKLVLCSFLNGKMGGNFDAAVAESELENELVLCYGDDEVEQDNPVGILTMEERQLFGFFGNEEEYSFYSAGTATVYKDERGEFYITESDSNKIYG